jgi:hypothetical protein
MAGITKAMGGLAEEMDPKIGPLAAHEMGYGDAGLAISFGAGSCPIPFRTLVNFPRRKTLSGN